MDDQSKTINELKSKILFLEKENAFLKSFIRETKEFKDLEKYCKDTYE